MLYTLVQLELQNPVWLPLWQGNMITKSYLYFIWTLHPPNKEYIHCTVVNDCRKHSGSSKQKDNQI